MLEVEVFGAGLAPDLPPEAEVHALCRAAAERLGVEEGHVAVEFVDSARIAELNRRHRGRAEPTDVLSFPIDGLDLLPRAAAPDDRERATASPPRELGDVVICPEHTTGVREAIIHGMLHLLGMDHEVDDGEMLALQRELLASDRG